MADTEKIVFDTSKLEACLEKNNQAITNVTKEIKKTQAVITSA